MIKITLKNGVEVSVDNTKEARELLGLGAVVEKKVMPDDVQKIITTKSKQHKYAHRYYKKHREKILAKQREYRAKKELNWSPTGELIQA